MHGGARGVKQEQELGPGNRDRLRSTRQSAERRELCAGGYLPIERVAVEEHDPTARAVVETDAVTGPEQQQARGEHQAGHAQRVRSGQAAARQTHVYNSRWEWKSRAQAVD